MLFLSIKWKSANLTDASIRINLSRLLYHSSNETKPSLFLSKTLKNFKTLNLFFNNFYLICFITSDKVAWDTLIVDSERILL